MKWAWFLPRCLIEGISMNIKRKLGIKPGRGFLESTSPKIMNHLIASGFEYIEYQAPIPNLKLLARHFELSCQHLLPHSVFQSLSLQSGISHVTAKRLASEIKLTKSSYLAEHLGSINPWTPYPSHYYLYPPQLNKSTIDRVIENVVEFEEIVGVPLALENSVFYFNQPNDTFSYIDFLEL